MLSYHQTKRDFTRLSWRRGNQYFRDNRVQGVTLDGDRVLGKVRGSNRENYDTALVMGKNGKIANSKCTCPVHRRNELHCKHVAALAIWLMQKGAAQVQPKGVAQDYQGEVVIRDPRTANLHAILKKLLHTAPYLNIVPFYIRQDPLAATLIGKDDEGAPFSIPITLIEATALREQVEPARYASMSFDDQVFPGDPVLEIRGQFNGPLLNAVTVESGIRFQDPETGKIEIITLTYLAPTPKAGFWKTTRGYTLRVALPSETLDVQSAYIQRLERDKIAYRGAQALEQLGKLLVDPGRERFVFDPMVDLPVDSRPLRLLKLEIGASDGEHRTLTYEFGAGEAGKEEVTVGSEELRQLSTIGRLSNNFVWLGDRLFKFEVPFSKLNQYARPKTKTAQDDPAEETEEAPTGFGKIEDTGENPLHPLAAYRLSLELGVEDFVVDPTWGDFQEWKKTFERKRLPALPKVEFGFDLRPYHTEGLKWLWSLYHRGLSALLADDMGLGKTHQVLAFLTSLYGRKSTAKLPPTLVVAPSSVVAAWQQKLAKYDTGLKWVVFHGAGRKLPDSGVQIVLTTYGILSREALLKDKEWLCVVLDEAQAIKNATTLVSTTARSLKGRYRIAMTGTPVENSATDLWALMDFLIPGYLGSIQRFKRLYAPSRDTGGVGQNVNVLKRLVQPFLLRRTKGSVLKDLPEKIEQVVECEMTQPQRKEYAAWLNSEDVAQARQALEAGGKVNYAHVLAMLTRLKQICNHPGLPGVAATKNGAAELDPTQSGKWEAFEELLGEALGSNLKVVVFTQYLGMMDLIGKNLLERGIGYTELRGDTQDRGVRLDRFARDPNCKVFVCSLLAGGLGIDLTSASVCVHFDRWWNPARENQATDRLHRFGQTRGVQVFKLQIPGTVEDRIARILESKVALSDALIEESGAGLKSFSRKELLELLTLAPSGSLGEEQAQKAAVMASEG